MTTTMTLSALQTAVRQRANMEGSQFVTDAELTSYINQSYFELYDLLVQKYGNNYYVATAYQFTTDGTNQLFSLPTDFYKLLGVDLSLTGANDSFVTIKQFNMSERNRYSVPNFQSFYGITNMRYRLNGDKIFFTPVPKANQLIQLWYIPRMTQLASAGDVVEGVSGWTEYIIVDAAIKCLVKEESDPTMLLMAKVALEKRIEMAAENRDAANPATVADTSYNDFSWQNGSGSGYGSY